MASPALPAMTLQSPVCPTLLTSAMPSELTLWISLLILDRWGPDHSPQMGQKRLENLQCKGMILCCLIKTDL